MTETKPITIFLGSSPESAAVRIHQCQQQWDELQFSSRPDVRFCDHCQRDVHRVVDVDGFDRAVANGQCVMVAGFDPVEAVRQMFVGQAGALSYEVNAARPPLED